MPPGDYRGSHPDRSQLVVEVSASSLRKDRSIKVEVYAAAGVPEYWVVNLVDGVIEVYTEVAHGTYRRIVPHRRGDTIRLTAFPDVAIEGGDVV